MSSPNKPVIVQSDEGRVLHAFGEEVILRLGSEQTGGRLNVWTEITPPDGGPPPHYHKNEDEWFFVEEGTMSFFAEGKWHEVKSGGSVYAPRNSVHTFKNVGTTPSRMLVTTSPGGFDTFFSRCADEFKKPGGPSMERVIEISAEHGIFFVEPGGN